ncbi:MAG: AAA family ATPase [Arenicellales bacterium]|nr:AAA family ATPase [Arenicellales bacterium]
MSDLGDWLNRYGLGKYTASLLENDIDFDILPSLSSEDLKELGFSLGDRKRFQSAVGELLTSESESNSVATATVSTVEAERRYLTVMFADLAGSTELSLLVDPEVLRQINRRYQDTVTASVERFDGYVARYMGDGVLAYFGYPQAHEDDAERAIHAGLDIISSIKNNSDEIAPGISRELRVRIGIESGPVVVGDVIGKDASRESPVVGETPNLAARLQGLAEPNTVIVGPGTYALAGDPEAFKSLGEQNLKGFPDPVNVWQVVGMGSHSGRFERSTRSILSRFVGRTAEIELLEDCWSRARSANTIVVYVSGDAGIGKSRLVYEFLNRHRADTTILEGHCVSHGASTAFLPFLDILRRRCDLSDNPSTEQISERLGSTIRHLGIDNYYTPYLKKLFGVAVPEIADVDTELVGVRTREALVTFVLAHTRGGPTILYLNDLHWIDNSSAILLQSLARGKESSYILVVCTSRPDYQPKWDERTPVTTIALGPLSSAETTLLFRDNYGASVIRGGVLDTLLERSGGNPLFAEELARHLGDQVHVGEDDIGESIIVPETLEGLLLQRVDTLSSEPRRLLQAAAVAGRRFRIDLVGRIAKIDLAADTLDELERQNLVLPDFETGRMTYRFKHALVHDAVYGSLLKSDQQALHLAIGTELEHMYQNRETEIAEELAWHFRQAHDNARAATYSALAGDKALGLFAITDSRNWYTQALEQITSDPDLAKDELLSDVVVNQLEVYCFDADFHGMVELAETHLPRIQRTGQTQQLSRTLSWLGEAYVVSSRFVDAARTLKQALEIAEKLDDAVCVGYATGDLMWLYAVSPDPTLDYVELYRDRAVKLAESHEIPYLKTLAYYASALELAQRGYVSEARDWASKSIALGQEQTYPPALSWGHSMRAYVETYLENHDGAVVEAHEAIRNASCEYDLLMGRTMLGYALVLQGNIEQGIIVLEEIRPEILKRSVLSMLHTIDLAYGMAHVASGHIDKGISWFHDLQEHLSNQDNKRPIGRLHLALGELHLKLIPDVDPSTPFLYWKNIELSQQVTPIAAEQAERHLNEAVSVSQEASMPGIAAHALYALAVLSSLDNKVEEANDLVRRARRLAAPLGWTTLQDKLVAHQSI